jgi:asparagine synthase (glutamine-hydrolysing)
MCGIGGILHANPAHEVRREQLDAIVAALRHRGPDSQGVHLDGACGLAHTRLSILDLSARGRQPMASPSGRYLLSYNGEIYNFRELREELRRKGRRFESDSDTEVILHLVEAGGPAALTSLRGMFAFALFDRQTRELLLMRDRLGIKPLFFSHDANGVAFASEPKALPAAAARSAPSPERIAEYLAFRHAAEQESLAPGVRTLLPGHWLRTDGRALAIERWWRPPDGRDADPDETARLLAECVQRQLVSDVPVGVFLSGGVDSALVAASAAEALPSLDTFTVGFAEAGWDESARARIVADAIQAKAHRFVLTPEAYVAGLAEAVWHLDAPLNHAHSVHLLALARFARRHVTVVLTGEGSDELFAGYPRYRLYLLGRALAGPLRAPALALARLLPQLRGRWERLLDASDADETRAAAANAAFVPLAQAAALAGVADERALLAPRLAILAQAHAEGRAGLYGLLELDRRTYLVSLLQRMDRMTMAAGLEARVPVLDEELLDFATTLASSHKVDWRDSKKPMRRAARQRFGREYAHAPKFGFGVPLDAWMRAGGALEPLLARLLGERATAERGWFDVAAAKRCFEEHRRGEADRSELLWGLLNLELWARVCVEGGGPGALAA